MKTQLGIMSVITLLTLTISCGTTKKSSPASTAMPTTAESATKLVFTNSALMQVTGACGLLTIQPQNGTSAVAAVTNGHVVKLSSSDTSGAFYSDSACATTVTSVTITAGADSAKIYFKDTAAGSPTVTATDSFATPLIAATQVESIVTLTAETATKLVFTNAALSLTTGSCGALTIDVQNDSAAETAVTNPHSVNLTSSATTGAFYSDSGCATAVTSIALAVGAKNATVYYKDSAVGAPTLTATDTFTTPFTAATQAETIAAPIAETATQLVFTNTALSQAIAACGALTLATENDSAVQTAVTNAHAINLTSSATTGVFYSDSGCATAVTSIALAVGANNATVYYKDSAAGTPTLTATDAFVIPFKTATQAQSIATTASSSSPVALAITSAALNQAAGACGAVVLITADSSNAAAALASALPIGLSSSSNQGEFFSDAACSAPIVAITMAAGDSSATFYYKDLATGSPTLTATDAGMTLTAATQIVTITASPAAAIAFVYSTASANAGICTGMPLQIVDSASQPSAAFAADVMITMTGSPSNIYFYGNNSCSGTPATSFKFPAGVKRGYIYFYSNTKTIFNLTLAPIAGSTITFAPSTQLLTLH